MTDEIPQAMIAQFLAWEQFSRDTIDFKKVYVDIAGDLVAGLVLSQIVFWHLPGRNGVTKLRVNRDGELWVAKKRSEWWDEIRITPKQLDRALTVLEDRHLIVTALYGFNGKPTKHVRLRWSVFLEGVQSYILPKGENVILPKVKMHFDQRLNSNTETTTESTTDSIAEQSSALSKSSKKLSKDQCLKDAVAVHIQQIDLKLAGKQTGYL